MNLFVITFIAIPVQWLQIQFQPQLNKPAKTVEVDLGVIQKQNKNGTKLQFTLIKSKYKTAEAIINSLFSKILGGAVNLKKINLVLEKFLKDTSSDPYFVRLARAFDLQIETDYEALAKRIPKDGPTIIVSNHPRNGSDGIALAAAISKVRGNVKVVMNNFLKEYPGMNENAIFLNPYGGPKAKRENANAQTEMENHLKSGGVIVIFPAGDVSVKEPFSTSAPIDPIWRLGTARILQAVPETQVVNAFVDGSASDAFYATKKWGPGLLVTIFHVREIVSNIGRSFAVKFSNPEIGKNLIEKSNDSSLLMNYLRSKTYALAPDLKSKNNTPEKREFENNLVQPMEKSKLEAALKKGRIIYGSRGIDVYMIKGSEISEEAMIELGRVRESAFRTVGEGTGKPYDIDEHDKNYLHFIAFDPETKNIIGAYRVGQVDQLVKKYGLNGLYTNELFDEAKLIELYGHMMLELGRSFVDFTAGARAVRAMDSLWKGISAFIADNPQYRFLIGPVSISNDYSTKSKIIMLEYLKRKMDPYYSSLIKPRSEVNLFDPYYLELTTVAKNIHSFKELTAIITAIDGKAPPSLLKSYGDLNAKYLNFNFDSIFNTIDGLILVDILDPESIVELKKHFQSNWDKYAQNHTSVQYNSTDHLPNKNSPSKTDGGH